MSTDQPGTTGTTGTQSDEITHELRDGVAWITLNRPQAGNSITADQRERLIGWLEEANADHDVRCVVIGATGRFFCTGADLRQPKADDAGDAGPPPEKVVGDVRRMMLGGTIRLMNAVLDCEKPVIAAVQGTAAGIGAHLALCCDLVIASEDAKLIEVFARRGLAVDGLGSWLLPRLVGLLRAKELVLLAEDIPARRAEELGLVTRVVPAEELQSTVEELAGRLAEGPTRALAASKWMLNRSMDLDRHAMAQEEAWIVDAISRTHDADEGVASYVERRSTRFQGR
jgi:2-(1,2-epoxy-1,2-dihydrophenyl)acetyl-CoA isomerase